jgi:hypothetical protein
MPLDRAKVYSGRYAIVADTFRTVGQDFDGIAVDDATDEPENSTVHTRIAEVRKTGAQVGDREK